MAGIGRGGPSGTNAPANTGIGYLLGARHGGSSVAAERRRRARGKRRERQKGRGAEVERARGDAWR
jgi:hypothetical protein